MARSYIKLYGPPLLKGIRALEKIVVEMSEKTTMRFYNVYVPSLPEPWERVELDREFIEYYATTVLPGVDIPASEKVKLISRASDTLGDYDFFFEWGEEPTKEQVLELIEKIDEALAKCGCKYTIVTK